MNKSKSLYYSFLDGIFASVMTGFTMNYVVPFGLVLGAKNIHVALLNALPQLFSSIAQLRTAEIVERLKSRLKIISLFVFLHGISYLIVISLLFVPQNFKIQWFIFLTTLSSVLTAVAAPAWWSLMSDTVDKDKYGEYFAWRGKVLGFLSLVSSFIAGWFLGVIDNKFMGFIILFFLSGLSRLISGYFISKMDDIETKVSSEKNFSYFDFLKRFKESNFVKYVFFVALFNLGVSISSPFFSVYMLRELKMTYLEYTIVTISTALAGLLFLPFWGKTADKIGNVKVIKVTGLLICLLPILWIFSKNFLYLILINSFAGYVWAGFNLSTVNFIFDVASQETRTRCVGYFNFTNGIFIFLGTMFSGWLATHLPDLVKGSKLLTLFLLSGILRTIVVFVCKNKFYEVKKVEQIETKDFLLTVLGVKPVLDFSKDLFYPLVKLKKNKKFV